MKRYFQPVAKDGPSPKKPSLPPSSVADDLTVAEPDPTPALAPEGGSEPTKFVTWNANSLLLRVKKDWPEFTKFVQDIDPDVICVQEVRMPAAGSKGGPKNHGDIKDDTGSAREEKQVLMRALSKSPFCDYRVWWSLADSKYGGTALFVKRQFQSIKVSFNLDEQAGKHEVDGRVILAEFETFRLLNTYVPNNGWKDDETSFQRRRKWDKRMLEFVQKSLKKPLIWCGDLNVSHQDIDVTHLDFFISAKLNGYIPPHPEDCGQPGFTLSERKRFTSILSSGKLVDAYRYMHKEKDTEKGFSWSGNPVGKYRGKRMRIDYFVISEQLKDRITECTMHGQGIELQGFYGSDHCPVSLELSPGSSPSIHPM